MTDRERNHADLLDGFMNDPDGGHSTPPDDLDPALASVAVMLAAELTPPEPSAGFVRRLDQRLTAGPATSNNLHQAELSALSSTELPPQTAPADWREAAVGPRRSRLSEFARLAAAVLAIMLIGSALIFMFSEREDELAPGIGVDPDASTGSERLYVVSWDGVTAIDTSSDTELFAIDANNPYAVLSPDGTRLHVVGAGGVDQLTAFDALSGDELWRTTVRHRLYYIPGGGGPSILNVSPDGGQVYVHSYDNVGDFGEYGSDAVNIPTWVRVIDAQTGEHLFDTEKIPGYCHAEVFASVQSGLIHEICMNTGLIRVSDRETGEMLDTVNAGARIISALPSPNHSAIYLIGNMLRVFDAETGAITDSTVLRELPIAQYPFGLSALSPDGNLLYVGLRYGDGRDTQRIREIAVIDTSSWTEVDRITVDVDLKPGVLNVSADGQSLYAAEQLGSETAGKVVRIDIASGETSTVLIRNSEILRILSSSQSIEGPSPNIEVTPTPQPEMTPVDQPSPTSEILTEPPRASLTYEDQTQTHSAHTYCWPEPLRSGEMGLACSEADRGPPDRPAIHVPAGASLSFEVEGGHAFTPLGAEAVRLIPYPEPSTTSLTFDFPGAGIPFQQGPDGTFIVADVPDGDYSFEVGISMDIYPGHQGNASYAFRVIVGDPDAPPPEEPEKFEPVLTYEDQSQAGIFSYGCNWEGDPVCVDPDGLRFPTEVVDVPEGASLIFGSQGPENREFSTFQAFANSLEGANVESSDRGEFLPSPLAEGIMLPASGTIEAMHVVTDLPPGDYVIAMNVSLTDGSGTYGFRVRVTEVTEPWKEPNTTGTIMAIEERNNGRSIYLVEFPDNPDSGDQYYIFIGKHARVFESIPTGFERLDYTALDLGMRVTVAFVGDVDTSYPAFADGHEIVILERSTDS